MFRKSTKHNNGNKKINKPKKALTDFLFFNKLNYNNINEVIDIADSIISGDNDNINDNIDQISEIIQKAPIAELIKYMKCDNEIIRSISSQAFADYDSANLYNCIDLMLTDDSENLRASCMEALYNLIDEKTTPLLKKGMEDKSPKVRLKAALALAEIARICNNKEALTILNDNINDPDPEVKELIIDELGLIGSDLSITGLFNAMEELNEEQKEIASESLEIIIAQTFNK